jgi:hypothetical protein
MRWRQQMGEEMLSALQQFVPSERCRHMRRSNLKLIKFLTEDVMIDKECNARVHSRTRKLTLID